MDIRDSLEQQERDIQSLREHGIAHFQIENTSRCNYRCLMCDRAGPGRDMDDALVAYLAARFPALIDGGVSLSGLGEPLMADNFLTLARRAKEVGLHLSFPSNGFYLTDPLIDAILETKVDAINFSVDAASPETFEAIHGMAGLDRVVANVDKLVARRNAAGQEQPVLSLCVAMLRQNIDQFADLVRLGAELGLSRVAFINLTPCREEHLDQILYNFPGRELPERLLTHRDASVRKAKETGGKLGINVEVAGFDFLPAQYDHCDNLGGKLYISAMGDVSVCPIAGTPTPRFRDGQLTSPRSHVFGNLLRSTLAEILGGKTFQEYYGHLALGRVPEFCLGCNWAHAL